MLTRRLFIPFLVFASSVVSAQTFSEADSLKKLLSSAKEDTTKVILLKQLCVATQYTFPDSAYSYAKQGLTLARKLDFTSGEAMCLNEIGNVLYLYSNYPRALDYYLQSLKLKEKLNDLHGIAISLDNIGILYTEENEPEKALDYFTRARQIDAELKSEEGMMIDDLNMGAALDKLGKTDSALILLRRSRQAAGKIKDVSYIGTILYVLGTIYSEQGKKDSAMYYFKQSIPYAEAISDYQNLGDDYLGLARAFKSGGPADSGIYYAKKALMLASGTYSKNILVAANLLYDFYKTKNDKDSTLKYLQLSVTIKDSLHNQEKVKEFQNLSFNERLRQEELAQQKIAADKARHRNIQLLIITVFLITFFLIIIILSKQHISYRMVEFLGLLALLLLFEFVAMFVYPWIDEITDRAPVLVLICSSAFAALLVPIHKKLERWMKAKISRNRKL